jgi:hypothetical protein
LEPAGEDEDLDIKMTEVIAVPGLWCSTALVRRNFIRHFYFVVRDRAYDGAGKSKQVRQLLQDGGPYGNGMKTPCTASMYGRIIDTVTFVLGYNNLVDFGQSGTVVMDIGMGLGAFTILLVVLGLIVWGCEKDLDPYKLVVELITKLDRSFKTGTSKGGMKIDKQELTRAPRPFLVPWRITNPSLHHLDVRRNAFVGPSSVDVILALLGCDNDTVINCLHAFLRADPFPARGIIFVIECYQKGQLQFLKKLGVIDEDEGNIVKQRDGSPFKISDLVGDTRRKLFIMAKLEEHHQDKVWDNVKYMRDKFPPDFQSHPRFEASSDESSENEDDMAAEEGRESEGEAAEDVFSPNRAKAKAYMDSSVKKGIPVPQGSAARELAATVASHPPGKKLPKPLMEQLSRASARFIERLRKGQLEGGDAKILNHLLAFKRDMSEGSWITDSST